MMLKKGYILFLYFSFISFVHTQEWINVNPSFEPEGNYNMTCGIFLDSQNGWFTEDIKGRIFKTTDSGFNWLLLKDSMNAYLTDIKFVNKLNGWVAGKSRSDQSTFLLHTTDGGNSWEKIPSPMIYSLSFLDSLRGFAGGSYNMHGTTDAGHSWDTLTVEPKDLGFIRDIYFIDDKRGWAVGSHRGIDSGGIILNTIDSGKTWQVNLHSTGVIGRAVYFRDYLNGWVAGYPFRILRTNDGGKNWEIYDLEDLEYSTLIDMAFSDDNNGWAVGFDGSMWNTKDGGLTWDSINLGIEEDLNEIVFVEDGQVGYIFGDNNTLLRNETSVNVGQDDSVVSSTIRIHQNYPNPFNSQTIIQYELVQVGFVSLRVYNLLGQEVVDLVYEEQQPGIHNILWTGKDRDGQNVGSGIYYYRLASNSVIQIRKMVLVR